MSMTKPKKVVGGGYMVWKSEYEKSEEGLQHKA